MSVVHNEKSSAEVCSEENSVANVCVDLADEGVNCSPCRKLDHIANRDVYLNTQHDKVENLLEEEVERGTLLDNNAIQIAKIEKHFREQQRLMSGMELFHKQLNRLRSENLSLDINVEEYQINADLKTLQRELLLLDVANEKLGIIFPSYRTLNGYGNTLERVLSLEVELAEALQVKKKPESHFQSSFLKQYNDDEAIFQSFRDINELIKDMLELKKRNAAVESELQDMQDRYSQLSLKFAEVEGERQKLVMSLKNRRQKKS
ncbi:hypothetical protein HPP92_005466 [Vanilla planifolia]|uniref:Uncharacterized protein n=1 Tax=Vanilla planifolia TaxID=51239 RepID=A0A835RYP7_VANPL|nr:hypothetical protein HPP92_005805 [Vanilla planifolia]KAG0494472.1 hypothetical protein HPP92_005466 [Vanilla planifolia]